MSYELVKFLHVLGAIVILGTGTGIAFFMLAAHRTGDARFVGRTAAVELGKYGITVNNIAPGMILTPMNERAISDQEYLNYAEQQIVLGRAGLPEDIANMALFLASDAGSYCTGQTHYVDGGWMLTWPPV